MEFLRGLFGGKSIIDISGNQETNVKPPFIEKEEVNDQKKIEKLNIEIIKADKQLNIINEEMMLQKSKIELFQSLKNDEVKRKILVDKNFQDLSDQIGDPNKLDSSIHETYVKNKMEIAETQSKYEAKLNELVQENKILRIQQSKIEGQKILAEKKKEEIENKLLGLDKVIEKVSKKAVETYESSNISNEETHKNLQDKVDEKYENIQDGMVEQFRKDVNRGYSFRILNYNREFTKPLKLDASSAKTNEEKQKIQDEFVKDQADRLNQVFSSEDDKKWILPLQALINQNIPNVALGVMKMNITGQLAPFNNNVIKATIPDDFIFEIFIERDENKKIKGIRVSYKGGLDLELQSEDGASTKLVKKDVCSTELDCLLTLDEKGKPVIGEFKHKLSK